MDKSLKNGYAPLKLATFVIAFLGVMFLSTPEAAAQNNGNEVEVNEIIVFQIADLDGLREYVNENIVYPESALTENIEGVVTISFVVKKTGEVTNVKVVESPDESLSKEVLRVMESAPDWVPTIIKGRRFKYRYTLPIEFKLH